MAERATYTFDGHAYDNHDNYIGRYRMETTAESYEKAASNFKWRIAKEYNVSGVITLDGKITKKGGEG